MVHPVYTPRLNNNDDEVRVSALLVSPGQAISAGQALAEVETDKANFVVEAERAGHVLAVCAMAGQPAAVGSVLMWVGDEATEQVPVSAGPGEREPLPPPAITVKARLLLAEHGLDAASIPHTGERIGVQDVEAYLAGRTAVRPAYVAAPALPTGGTQVPLSAGDRGMLRSVLWHRDEAAAAYLELEYDPEPWERYAIRYAERARLLSSPLLPLMMRSLASIAAKHPRLNSTIVDGRRFVYDQVNLGFTIQTDETLYVAVIRDAAALAAEEMVKAFNRLHRRSMGHRLSPEETQGATVGFSSMARWPVRRHIPILPPFVSLMCAHAMPPGGPGVLGASYDHRVLSGCDTQAILARLIEPPEE